MKSVPFCHIRVRERERISRRDDINVISRSVIGCSPVSLIVYARFFEKGDQGPVIIRFQFRGMERFPRARGRHARYDSRRCPVSRIHGIHCVTKLPLHEQEIRCARRAKKLGCIPFAIVPLASTRSSRSTVFPTICICSIFIYYLLSLLSSDDRYKICKRGIAKVILVLVQIGGAEWIQSE